MTMTLRSMRTLRDASICSRLGYFYSRKVRMSNQISREDLIASVMQAVAAFQDATDGVDEAASRQLGLNRTDLRCLGILTRVGPITAGQLAAAAGLSPGATTTAVDRLARVGYAERVHDEHDRRRIRVQATPV